MRQTQNRREFLAATAGAAVFVGAGANLLSAEKTEFKTKLYKALIARGAPGFERLKQLKDAGFDGMEAGIVDPEKAKKCRENAEKLGMRIHSVLRGWAQFNSRDPRKVEESIAVTEKALKAAQAYGADAVLLVPCKIGGMPMPRPWEFVIDFDPETGHLKRVTAGDNRPFQAYIEAHNHATDTSKEAIKRLIPVAEKTGVIIAVENVWNNLWVKPRVFRNFVESFKSPWVRAYFDIANHVKYCRPEEWILTLSELIVKCHVKEFKLDPWDPNGGGSWEQIREGSVRWPIVRRALERIGYNGWTTIEGCKLPLKEASRRLDLIIAGK